MRDREETCQLRSGGALHITPVSHGAIFSVKTWEGASTKSRSPPARVGSLEWPAEVGVTTLGPIRIACLAPAEWLVVSTKDEAPGVRATLCGDETPVAAVDLTDAFAGFCLEGATARAVIGGACGLDLDPSQFAPGCCARTRLAQVPAFIAALAEPNRYELLVARSYAAWLAEWLEDAKCGL